ncbi:MAG: hypothetical protein ACOYWZ_11080 [Bacillota bacterium]
MAEKEKEKGEIKVLPEKEELTSQLTPQDVSVILQIIGQFQTSVNEAYALQPLIVKLNKMVK